MIKQKQRANEKMICRSKTKRERTNRTNKKQ